MQNKNLFEEPIEFIFSENLLSGSGIGSTHLEASTIMEQFYENDPSSIVHLVEAELSKFRFHKDYKQCNEAVDGFLRENNDRLHKKYLSYRKAKVKKQNTAYDDFFFSVFDEIYEHLKIIALHRAVFGLDKESPLEKLFSIYKQGLLPYRFDNGAFQVFNPAVLK